MPITEALKKLIKTITGKNAVGETIEELVTNLNDNYPEGGGGGGESYETVAEIAIGTMAQRDDGYMYVVDNVEAPVLDTATTYYLNSTDTPSDLVINDADEDVAAIMFNTKDHDDVTPIDPSVPVVEVQWTEHQCAVFATEDKFSNTTVKILKKSASGGSGGGVKMIHATATPSQSVEGESNLEFVETAEEIYAMVSSGKPVAMRVLVPTPVGQLPAYAYMFSFYEDTESGISTAVFNMIAGSDSDSLECARAAIVLRNGGVEGEMHAHKYDFSPKVVKVDFSVDYENKVLLSASHKPDEVVRLVEGGTWVYGYDTTKGLYELTHINKTENPTDVVFNGRFGDDSSIETDENGDWIYRYK